MEFVLIAATGFLLVVVGYQFGKRSKEDIKTEDSHYNVEDRAYWEQVAEEILW